MLGIMGFIRVHNRALIVLTYHADGETLLHHAAANGRVDLIKRLLQLGAAVSGVV